MARKHRTNPKRVRTVLDEKHGFEHVEKTDPDEVQRQINEDFAARDYQGRHRMDETAEFAVWGGIAA